MDKLKVLLTGKNNIIIDDFFNQMDEDFISITTSLRYEDMEYHVLNFKPDLLVICLNGETRDDLTRIIEMKRHIAKCGVYPVVIGTAEECDDFERVVVNFAQLILKKPITATVIREQIHEFIKKKEEEKRELEALEAQMKAEAEQNRRKHVLVIDDDPTILKLVKAILHDKYDVATALNGRIARTFLSSKDTDLVLLDYEMPGETGPEVYATLREMDKCKELPILFLTGVSDKEKIKEVLVLRPQGYILKPIDSEKIMSTLEEFLG